MSDDTNLAPHVRAAMGAAQPKIAGAQGKSCPPLAPHVQAAIAPTAQPVSGLQQEATAGPVAERPLAFHVQAAMGRGLQQTPSSGPSPAPGNPARAPHVQAASGQGVQRRPAPAPATRPPSPSPHPQGTLHGGAHARRVVSVMQARGQLYLFTPTRSLPGLSSSRGTAAGARPGTVLQRAESSAGSSTTPTNLYGFNRDKDKPYPRKKDVEMDESGVITSSQRGLSVSADLTVSSSFLEGHLWLLPAGTDLGDLGVVADGKDVGGSHYPGHHTIYPAKPMEYGGAGNFKSKVKALPWQYLGLCALKGHPKQKEIATMIMAAAGNVEEISKILSEV